MRRGWARQRGNAQCLRDLPDDEQAFARFETLRRPRVEQIAKAAARISNRKAAGPAARRVRDTILPVIFKFAASSKQAMRPFVRHIGWDTPISMTTATPASPA